MVPNNHGNDFGNFVAEKPPLPFPWRHDKGTVKTDTHGKDFNDNLVKILALDTAFELASAGWAGDAHTRRRRGGRGRDNAELQAQVLIVSFRWTAFNA